MEDDGKTYILPHHPIIRLVLTLAGLFAFIISPYELWRGVWPLNVTSPFFGFIMLGGMSVGLGVLNAGLITPSAKLVFTGQTIIVERQFLWGSTKQVIRNSDLSSITVRRQEQSEGPDEWIALITMSDGATLPSRSLGTEATAQKLAAEFSRLLSR